MLSDFKDRFRYDHWANSQLRKVLVDNPPAEEESGFGAAAVRRAAELFTHLLDSELVWLGRIRDTEDQKRPLRASRPLDELRVLVDHAANQWRGFIESLDEDDLQRVITYRNTGDEEFENTIAELMTHVLNHSAHHRAQVILLIRETGAEPPPTDFIQWLRQGRPG